jgi:hypothetical protein
LSETDPSQIINAGPVVVMYHLVAKGMEFLDRVDEEINKGKRFFHGTLNTFLFVMSRKK